MPCIPGDLETSMGSASQSSIRVRVRVTGILIRHQSFKIKLTKCRQAELNGLIVCCLVNTSTASCWCRVGAGTASGQPVGYA
eukprot:351952-Chlamydomonas_euryale.AAC.13